MITCGILFGSPRRPPFHPLARPFVHLGEARTKSPLCRSEYGGRRGQGSSWPATMRTIQRVEDTDEARARARILAHFEDNQQAVFYSRQLEVMFEREYFHWVTNRALRRLVEEGRIVSETRTLDLGSELKLLWHHKYRFTKRAAREVFDLVNRYSSAATDGTLGLQGEHLVLAAFARERYLLIGENAQEYGGERWRRLITTWILSSRRTEWLTASK